MWGEQTFQSAYTPNLNRTHPDDDFIIWLHHVYAQFQLLYLTMEYSPAFWLPATLVKIIAYKHIKKVLSRPVLLEISQNCECVYYHI